MNVGDRIYCYASVTDIYLDNYYYTTINNSYEIITIEDDYITIINDTGGSHSFSLDKNDDEYWKKWFCDIRELRKKKLKNIEEVRKCLNQNI